MEDMCRQSFLLATKKKTKNQKIAEKSSGPSATYGSPVSSTHTTDAKSLKVSSAESSGVFVSPEIKAPSINSYIFIKQNNNMPPPSAYLHVDLLSLTPYQKMCTLSVCQKDWLKVG